jgi:iron complex outermembrane receptor protein
MRIRTRGGRRRLLLFVGLGWAFVTGRASKGAAPVKYHLQIAPQPLDSALQEFARQSGVQVVYFSRLTHGLRAPALDGYYTLEVAIRALLAQSGLNFRVINAKTVEIKQETHQ